MSKSWGFNVGGRLVPKAQLQEALDAVPLHYGSITNAAKALGIPRSTLQNRLLHAASRQMEANTAVRVPKAEGKGLRTLFIGDLHAPFHHPDTLAFLTEAKEKLNPQRIVFSGDELDQHAISQHDPDPDGYSAGHELNVGLEFMQGLYTLFPVAGVCTSNHGARPFKKAYANGLPKAYLKSYADFMGAPKGWWWADRIEVDGVVYQHGEGYSGQNAALNAAKDNMRPTCIGHIHGFAGIQYFNNGDKQIWGFNVGCIIDTTSYAFAYGKHHRSKPIIGVGLIDKGTPSFYPMQMDHNRRWTGQL